jgi:hypothetical protein
VGRTRPPQAAQNWCRPVADSGLLLMLTPACLTGARLAFYDPSVK